MNKKVNERIKNNKERADSIITSSTEYIFANSC